MQPLIISAEEVHRQLTHLNTNIYVYFRPNMVLLGKPTETTFAADSSKKLFKFYFTHFCSVSGVFTFDVWSLKDDAAVRRLYEEIEG